MHSILLNVNTVTYTYIILANVYQVLDAISYAKINVCIEVMTLKLTSEPAAFKAVLNFSLHVA